MTRSTRTLTRSAMALTVALAAAGTSWAAPTGAQAQTNETPLIAAGRLALPLSAFGAGARIDHQHIDRGAVAIDRDNTLAAIGAPSHQGRRYTLFGGGGTLFQGVALPATDLTSGARRVVLLLATVFPTTGAAREVYNRDTTFLGSTYAGCGQPNLVAARGRYSTRACQYHKRGQQSSYLVVAGVQGNVEFTLYLGAGNDDAGSPLQLRNDASTVARAAFAAYRLLPVRRGPAPYIAPAAPVAPVAPAATSTPRPAPTSTPIPVPPTATRTAGTLVPATPVPVVQSSGPYQVTVSGATVYASSDFPKTYNDGSTMYSYQVRYDDGTQGFYLVNADNPDAESAQQASADFLSEARKPFYGGTPQVYTSGAAWLVVEHGTTVCRASIGGSDATDAFGVSVTNADCAVAAAHAKSLSYSVIDAL